MFPPSIYFFTRVPFSRKMAEEHRPRFQFLNDMKMKVHIRKESPVEALQEAVAVIKKFAVA
jgi:hypothetical protein